MTGKAPRLPATAKPDAPEQAAPAPLPPTSTLDNQAAQAMLRGGMSAQNDSGTSPLSSPAVPTITFDPDYPWTFTATGNTDELAIMAALYGPGVSVPLRQFQVPKFDGVLHWETRCVVVPQMLQSPYATDYQDTMRRRRAALDIELTDSVAEIKEIALANAFSRLHREGRVIDIMRRWANEPFPIKPGWLDRLFTAMNGVIFDTGWIATSYTNLYSYVLNHFARADEIRALRDQYAPMYRHEEALPEAEFWGTGDEDFFGILWNERGQIPSRIKNFGVGMGKAAVGFVKGLATLVTDPGKVLNAIVHLPGTLKTLWQNRTQLWNAFANASPDEQARMIGRLFGEVEILIATAGAGAGPDAASKAPQAARALEIAEMGRGGAAAARLGGGAIPIDLGVLGPEAARLTSLMTMTGEGATAGKQKADELATSQNQSPAEETRTSPAEPDPAATEQQRRAASELLGEGPETESMQVSDRPGWYGAGEEMPAQRGARTEWFERRLSHTPDRAAAEQAGRQFAADIGNDRLEYVSTSITERTPAGRAQVSAVTPAESPAAIEFEHQFRLTQSGLQFKPDGIEASGGNSFWFMDNKAQLGVASEITNPDAVRRIERVIETYAEVQHALADRGCRGLILLVDSSARQAAVEEILARFPASVRDLIWVRLRS